VKQKSRYDFRHRSPYKVDKLKTSLPNVKSKKAKKKSTKAKKKAAASTSRSIAGGSSAGSAAGGSAAGSAAGGSAAGSAAGGSSAGSSGGSAAGGSSAGSGFNPIQIEPANVTSLGQVFKVMRTSGQKNVEEGFQTSLGVQLEEIDKVFENRQGTRDGPPEGCGVIKLKLDGRSGNRAYPWKDTEAHPNPTGRFPAEIGEVLGTVVKYPNIHEAYCFAPCRISRTGFREITGALEEWKLLRPNLKFIFVRLNMDPENDGTPLDYFGDLQSKMLIQKEFQKSSDFWKKTQEQGREGARIRDMNRKIRKGEEISTPFPGRKEDLHKRVFEITYEGMPAWIRVTQVSPGGNIFNYRWIDGNGLDLEPSNKIKTKIFDFRYCPKSILPVKIVNR
jgi:hypothetical protein